MDQRRSTTGSFPDNSLVLGLRAAAAVPKVPGSEAKRDDANQLAQRGTTTTTTFRCSGRRELQCRYFIHEGHLFTTGHDFQIEAQRMRMVV